MRCPTCPRAKLEPCIAERSGHLRFCELADESHADFSAEYRAWIKSETLPAIAEAIELPCADAESHKRSSIVASIARCPFRSRRPDGERKSCGCPTHRCEGGARDGEAVTFNDCARCVTSA